MKIDSQRIGQELFKRIGLILFLSSFVFGMIVSWRFPFWRDDWYMLAYRAKDFSVEKLVTYLTEPSWYYAMTHMQWFRPIGVLFYVGLYSLFGYSRIFYHVAKALMLSFFSVILYKTMFLISKDRVNALLITVFLTFSFTSASATYLISNHELLTQAFVIATLYSMYKFTGNGSLKWVVSVPIFTILSVCTKETGKIIPVLLLALTLMKRKEVSKKTFRSCMLLTAISTFLSFFPELLPNLLLKGSLQLGQYWYKSGLKSGQISLNLPSLLSNASLQSVMLFSLIPSPLIFAFFLYVKPKRLILLALPFAGIVSLSYPVMFGEIPSWFRPIVSFGGWVFVITVFLKGMHERKFLLSSWMLGTFGALTLLTTLFARYDKLIPVVIPFVSIILLSISKAKVKLKFPFLAVLLFSSAFVIQLVEINNHYVHVENRTILVGKVQDWLDKNLPSGSTIIYYSTLGIDELNYFSTIERLDAVVFCWIHDVEEYLSNLESWENVYIVNSPESHTALDNYVSERKESFEKIKSFSIQGIQLNIDPVRVIDRGSFFKVIEYEFEILKSKEGDQ